MAIITQTKRYLPLVISTKVQSVQLYRLTKDISFVLRVKSEFVCKLL